jgi:hypothetical protein
LCLLLLVLVTMAATSAWAQVQRVPREYRGLFGGSRNEPGTSQTSLSFSLTAMGGYDDNVLGSGGGTPGTTPEALTASGYNGLGTTELVFRHGKTDRFVEARGSGAVNVYSVEGTDTAHSFDAALRAETKAGRRSTLRANAGTTYQNYFTLAAVPIVLGPDAEVPAATSADFAVADRRSWAQRADAAYERGWNRSQTTTLRYLFDRVDYDEAPIEEEGVRFSYLGDSWSHTGSIDHRVALGRRSSLSGQYSYRNSATQRLDGTDRPFDEQRAEVTLRYEKRLSPRKTLSLEGGVGGALLDTESELTREPAEYWSTIGHARGRVDIGRSWSVQAFYQRGWELRQGFTVPFFTDEVTATVGGYIGRRFDLVFTGGYSTGVLGVTIENPYFSRDGSVQARYALTATTALIASYFRYYYEFDRPNLLPPGLAPTNDRQVFRLGLTFWLPLLGSWREPVVDPADAPGRQD